MKKNYSCFKTSFYSSSQALKVTVVASLLLTSALNGAAFTVPVIGAAPVAQAVQQSKTVIGMVKDSNGEPLIGATVMVQGTSNGVVTDMDGKFSIGGLSENSVLIVNYVGYMMQKINVAGKSELNIVMKDDSQNLDEVIVIGYGVQKKSNVTGAISSVKSDDLKNLPTTNAASALQGKVSGVQVINNSGAPGASSTIRIRGYSSNGVSDPLFVVDGLKVDNIDYLEPSSIESIEILKDAASAAIYGAEAGNGVVLITTKTGKKGDGRIFFDAQFTTSSLAHKVDVLNAQEFINYYSEVSPGNVDSFFNPYYYNDPGSTINGKLVDTDWQDAMFGSGFSQKYNVGFQGGNDKASVFISLGYLHNNGMVKGDSDLYKRVTGQLNASYKIKKWLEVGVNNSIETNQINQIAEGSVEYGTMCNVLMLDPLTPVEYGSNGPVQHVIMAEQSGYNPGKNPSTGNYYGVSFLNDAVVNPVAALKRTPSANKSFNINGMAYANIIPFKDFIFTTRLGYRFSNTRAKAFQDNTWASRESAITDPLLTVSQHTEQYYQWENFANYNFDWKGNNFSFLAGTSYSKRNITPIQVRSQHLVSTDENWQYLDYLADRELMTITGNETDRVQIAYYGRIGWSYKNRYNVQANFRADSYDAAYLDLDHNWGYFPSVSGGWTISNESFMEDVDSKYLSFAKLRFSWGKNGSISNLGGYRYASALISGNTIHASGSVIGTNSYWMNGQLVTGYRPNDYLANPKLRWEESIQYGVGLDLRFFSDRLSLSMDYYHKLTDGLLVETTAPLTTGTKKYTQNLGKVRNTGFEIEADWKGKIGKDFSYNLKGNLATVNNKVTEFQGEGIRMQGSKLPSASSYISYFEEGYPVWHLYGYQVESIDETDGHAIYKDFDGVDGITDADRTDLGTSVPDFTYGLTLSAAYKGFDAMVYGAGAQGSKLMYGLMRASTNTIAGNRPKFVYDGRWTSSNTHATQAAPLYQMDDKYYNSDRFIFDASFFKIKQIQLGYTIPKNVLAKAGLSSVRAYVSLDNFFTFTDYPGLDPEVRPTESSSMAIDLGGYPIAKSVSFGLNVSF